MSFYFAIMLKEVDAVYFEIEPLLTRTRAGPSPKSFGRRNRYTIDLNRLCIYVAGFRRMIRVLEGNSNHSLPIVRPEKTVLTAIHGSTTFASDTGGARLTRD